METFFQSEDNGMLKIEFFSSLFNLDRAVDEAVAFLSGRSENNTNLYDNILIIREALTNAVMHGNKENASMKIWFEINMDCTYLKVRDEGNGFDWRRYLTDEIPEITRPNGRGIFLIRAYGFDTVYNEEGNILTITKK